MDLLRPFRLRAPARIFAVLVAAFALGSTGCIKKMLLDGQIEGTRKGAEAMDSTADFEVARAASGAGLAQFEGMHKLAPDNTDAIYLLVKGYAGYAGAFAEDDMELAYLRNDDDLGDYHKERAKSLYTRAIGFGTQWLEHEHAGFDDALKSGDEGKMVEYLSQFDEEEDADILFWTGLAWMSRTNVTKESSLIGTVYVGRAMVERVIALQPNYEYGMPYVLIGSYKSSTGVATLGPESFTAAKAAFDKAEQISSGKLMLGKVQMAISYACHMADDSPGRGASFGMYSKLMNDVLAADDPDPDHRLLVAIAKRKARRYLSEKWIEDFAQEDCGWDLSAIPSAAPTASPAK